MFNLTNCYLHELSKLNQKKMSTTNGYQGDREIELMTRTFKYIATFLILHHLSRLNGKL